MASENTSGRCRRIGLAAGLVGGFYSSGLVGKDLILMDHNFPICICFFSLSLVGSLCRRLCLFGANVICSLCRLCICIRLFNVCLIRPYSCLCNGAKVHRVLGANGGANRGLMSKLFSVNGKLFILESKLLNLFGSWR